MQEQKIVRISKNSLWKFSVMIASILLVVLTIVPAISNRGYRFSSAQILYLVLPLATISIGYYLLITTKKYYQYVLTLGKRFLIPFLFSASYLMLFYLSMGVVRGAFSRGPIEITTPSPFSAANAVLWRFLWDIGYSGLAAIIVASVTPYFARFFKYVYDTLYAPTWITLGGKVKPDYAEKNYDFPKKVKTFVLLNTLFTAGVLLLLPKVTSVTYVEVISPFGTFLSPDPLLFLSIAPLLASILVKIRENSHRAYWTYMTITLSVLSITNIASFAFSPLAQADYLNILQILPGIYLYNIAGVSIFSVTLKEELIERVADKTKAFLALSLTFGFVVFLLMGWVWREFLWNLPSLVLYMLSSLLDALAVSVTVYSFCLIIQRTTRMKCYPKTSLFQTFLWMIVVGIIYTLNPNGTANPLFWVLVLGMDLVAGLFLFFFPRLSFFAIGLSLVTATFLYGYFGWSQIVISIGSVMISLKLRVLYGSHVAKA